MGGSPPRILDLDLDFFLYETAHWRGAGTRLDGSEFPPWDIDDVVSFLEDKCRVTSRLPGFAVENHGELFALWREAVRAELLEAPFHVTHVDAHADLGLGDSGYIHLMSDLLYRDPRDRLEPQEGDEGLNDGNYLAFAAACRWLSSLTYVHNDSGGRDLLTYHLEGFNPDAEHIQLKAMRRSEIDKLLGLLVRGEGIQIDRLEPRVPFAHLRWREFQADQPFDFICIARSPAYTPAEADGIFDEIRERFIDEISAAGRGTLTIDPRGS
jgi:hypothetical protein